MQFASIVISIAIHLFLNSSIVVLLRSSVNEKLDRLVVMNGSSLWSVIPHSEGLCLGIVLHRDRRVNGVKLFGEIVDVSSHYTSFDQVKAIRVRKVRLTILIHDRGPLRENLSALRHGHSLTIWFLYLL